MVHVHPVRYLPDAQQRLALQQLTRQAAEAVRGPTDQPHEQERHSKVVGRPEEPKPAPRGKQSHLNQNDPETRSRREAERPGLVSLQGRVMLHERQQTADRE